MATKLAAHFKPEVEVEVAQETEKKAQEVHITHVDKFNMDEVEVELEVEVAQEAENKPQEEVFVFEEDPEMYAAAGLPIPNISKPIDVDAAIKKVMSSVPDMKGVNVTFKVVVVTGNNSTMNF